MLQRGQRGCLEGDAHEAIVSLAFGHGVGGLLESLDGVLP